jgi:hypothetical protein
VTYQFIQTKPIDPISIFLWGGGGGVELAKFCIVLYLVGRWTTDGGVSSAGL